ncbi:hypothetical protein [Clostridium sp. BJN0001]|uniref:hypothetical protein n=1 Tax=Clostridium sp. BJN0001 TaxID=2930219 RepID=UPI001FD54584|nr:hypothetical protein [Clostridium sp. BJN0001]
MRTNDYVKEINKYSSILSEENNDKFSYLLLKLRFAPINNKDAEEFSSHVLDIFIQSQKENKKVEELLNTENIDVFANEFIEQSRKDYSIFEKIYFKINYIPLLLLIFTGIFEMLVGYLIKAWINKETLFTVPVTVSNILDILIAFFVLNFFLKNAYHFYKVFNSSDKKKNKIYTVGLYVFFISLTGIFVLSQLFLNYVVFKLNYLIFMGVLIVICIIQHIFENKND